MDIYKFINSCDIHEHLKRINYRFSALESAWIIWKSKYTSLTEKHEAWTELIETMPDCKIEERPNTVSHPSLHDFLRALMDFEKRCVEAVKKDDPFTFFTYKYLLSENDGWIAGQLFSDFSTCFSAAMNMCQSNLDAKGNSSCRIRIQKSRFDGSGIYTDVEITQNGEIVRIYNPAK